MGSIKLWCALSIPFNRRIVLSILNSDQEIKERKKLIKKGTFSQFETLFSSRSAFPLLFQLSFIVAQLNFIVPTAKKEHLNRNENTRISPAKCADALVCDWIESGMGRKKATTKNKSEFDNNDRVEANLNRTKSQHSIWPEFHFAPSIVIFRVGATKKRRKTLSRFTLPPPKVTLRCSWRSAWSLSTSLSISRRSLNNRCYFFCTFNTVNHRDSRSHAFSAPHRRRKQNDWWQLEA